MPAAYILYHYLRPALQKKNSWWLNRSSTRSSIIPSQLQPFASQLAINIPSGDFCIEVDSLNHIKDRERLDISTAEFCDLLCYIYPFVEAGTLFSEGKLYLYSKSLKTIFPFDVAFANIDRFFEYAPHRAILESLDRIVRLDRSRTLFQTLEPVFRDYINTKYPEISKSDSSPELDETQSNTEEEISVPTDYYASEEEDEGSMPCTEESVDSTKPSGTNDSSDTPDTSNDNNAPQDWKKLIDSIIVGYNKYNDECAPHKPIFLIALINLIDAGFVRTNQIRYDEILQMAFNLAWDRYNNRNFYTRNLRSPFITLTIDEIWNIETYDPSIKPQTTESWISKNVKYGSLHPEFYNTLKSSKEARQEIKEYIIRHFDLKH